MAEAAALLPGGRQTVNVHYRAVYSADGYNRRDLHKHCDQLMQALLTAETKDPSVRDGAVSVDLGTSIVEIEVVATGRDYQEAAWLAADRVQEIVRRVTGHAPVAITQQHMELVDA